MAEQLLSQRDATAQVLDDTAACVDHCINDVEFIRQDQMAKVLSKQWYFTSYNNLSYNSSYNYVKSDRYKTLSKSKAPIAAKQMI